MLETIRTQWPAKVVIFFFIAFTLWWTGLRLTNQSHGSNPDQLFAAVYGITALWGGIWGVVIAKKWGGVHSVMGRSILFFSLGLFAQEVGQILYSYYIYFEHIQDPYPSLGDYFFYGTIPLYIIGVVYLGLAAGVHISLRSFGNKLQALLIPAVMLVISYFVNLDGYKFDWTHPIKVLIDFGAPLGQAIYVSFALLTYTLTTHVLGGIMKSKVLFILFALLAQFVADWTFIYEANRNIWYAGELNDYQYFLAYFLMAFGLMQLGTVYNNLRGTK